MAAKGSPARDAARQFEKLRSSNAARFIAMSVNDKPFEFSQRLLAWHRLHGRHDLPWQSRPADAYKVWVSEIMLQQTQVATVIPYFNRFIARFPTLSALANASEQEVLGLWSGLGYYQRARNLHACAQKILSDCGGQFPCTAAALQTLPGIGRSTAAAITSAVFGERAAILDGNVKRVLARLTRAEAPWQSPLLERMLWQEATQRLPQAAADMPAYTQAIMDLGALVCKAREPLCTQCPVAALCQAHVHGQTAMYPLPRAKRELPTRTAHWAVFVNNNGVWLQQQPHRGIWPSLWVPWQLDLAHEPVDWKQTVQGLREVRRIRHGFSHYRLEIEAGVIDWPLRQAPKGAPKGLRWIAWAEVFSLGLPAPVRQILLTLCPSAIASDDESCRRNEA
jgi:A/G-specific adenine glycosylase